MRCHKVERVTTANGEIADDGQQEEFCALEGITENETETSERPPLHILLRQSHQRALNLTAMREEFDSDG